MLKVYLFVHFRGTEVSLLTRSVSFDCRRLRDNLSVRERVRVTVRVLTLVPAGSQ